MNALGQKRMSMRIPSSIDAHHSIAQVERLTCRFGSMPLLVASDWLIIENSYFCYIGKSRETASCYSNGRPGRGEEFSRSAWRPNVGHRQELLRCVCRSHWILTALNARRSYIHLTAFFSGRCSLHIAVLKENEQIVQYLASTFKECVNIGDNVSAACRRPYLRKTSNAKIMNHFVSFAVGTHVSPLRDGSAQCGSAQPNPH